MSNERIIQTSKPATLVTCKILIEGTELSKANVPLSIVVEKEVNRIPTAKIVFVDGDPSLQDFPLSNDDLLIPGKKIEITSGYQGSEESVFKGVIVKHNIKVRPQQALLIVECRDEAVKLTVGRKSKYFYESKDSDIIEEIIGTYGISKDIESTKFKHKELVQYNTTDWDFILSRAQANGKVCVIENGKISIKKPGYSGSEVETVSYGDSILDLDAEIDARYQTKKVTSYSWNAADQKLLEIEASSPSVKLNSNLSSDDLSSVINLKNLELKSGGGTADVLLQSWADAKLLFNQLSKVRGRAKFQGTPKIKPDTIVKLKGVGDRFNGKIYISAVRHQITEGNWTTDAQFGLNPQWFTEANDINDQPAAGLLAAVHGLQVGVVSQLENDPDKEDRILVKFPIVDDKEQGIWARIATLDAGKKEVHFSGLRLGMK